MSNISNMAAMKTSIENSEALSFASKVLSDAQFSKLYKSYRQLFLFQSSYVVVWVIALILSAIIFSDYIDIVILFGVTIGFVGLIFWMILSLFVAGRLWRKYFKWFKKGRKLDELYSYFE